MLISHLLISEIQIKGMQAVYWFVFLSLISTNHNFKQRSYYYIFHTVSPTDSSWGVEWVEMDNNESHCADSSCPRQFFNQTHLTLCAGAFWQYSQVEHFVKKMIFSKSSGGCLEVPLSWVASVIGRCDWGNTPHLQPPSPPTHRRLPEPCGRGFGLMQSYKDIE